MWRQGKLAPVPDSGHPQRIGLDGEDGFHAGEQVDIRVGGHWLRGRVEHGSRWGWYWTDNETDIPLRPGQAARVWLGGDYWPESDE